MATMKMALLRRGKRVQRWDYVLRGWVDWKGHFNPKEMGMRGSYVLHVKHEVIYLRRLSQSAKVQWDHPVPEGISAWDAFGGGAVVLPWEHTDMLMRAVAMCGIPLKLLMIHHMVTLTELKLSVADGLTSEGQTFRRYIETDGRRVGTEHGVRVISPTYVIEYEHYVPSVRRPDLKEGRWVANIQVWAARSVGGGVNPRHLVSALHKIGLSHSMQPWELDLYHEHFRPKT